MMFTLYRELWQIYSKMSMIICNGGGDPDPTARDILRGGLFGEGPSSTYQFAISKLSSLPCDVHDVLFPNYHKLSYTCER
jgi:hypothetical protein